jgi:hypothetical protein
MRYSHEIVEESSSIGINPLKTGKQFAMMPVRLLALPNAKLGRTAKLVLAIIMQAANGHTAWLSELDIAKRLGLTVKRSIMRALQELATFSEERDGKVVHCGLITVDRRVGRTNTYSIVRDSLISDLVDEGQFDQVVDNSSSAESPFVQLPNWLLRRPELSLGAKLTYSQLAWFCWKKGESYPRVKTLMQRTGMGRDTIFQGIAELVSYGLVKRTPRKDTSNQYVFLHHPWMDMCDNPVVPLVATKAKKRRVGLVSKGTIGLVTKPVLTGDKNSTALDWTGDKTSNWTGDKNRLKVYLEYVDPSGENTVDPSIYQGAKTHPGIETLQTSDSGSEENPDSSAHNADYRSRQGLVGFQGMM